MTRKRCYKRPEIKTFCLLAGRACIALTLFAQAAVAAGRYDDGKSVAVQSDGKIVVAGHATVGRAYQIALVRYNVDGSLDKNFNGTGKVITAVGDGDCKGEGLALQSDGKIVVAGYSFKPGGKDRAEFTVLRYNPDGTLDSGFGESGKAITDIGRDSDDATSVALQSDGKIVAAGRTFAPTNNDFAVARYNRDGKLDLSFNATGKATADFGKRDYAHSVAVQSDGKIVVAGDAEHGDGRIFAVARFNADGTPDISFNKTGKLTTDFGSGNAEARGVAVQSDGKIVVAGYASPNNIENVALFRCTADGNLDTSLGGTGKVITPVALSGSNATSVALQSDGKIVVAGFAVDGSGRCYDFALVRHNADGSLDTSFNDGGKITTPIGNGDARCDAIALQTDGRIVAAGSASYGDNSDFAVVRYNSDGKLDISFNSTGKVTTAIGTNAGQDQGAAEKNTGPSMATINDPDGYINVRDRDNKVIAKVKAGERFIAEQPGTESKRWEVYLKSGIRGWTDRSRIRLLPDEPLMKFNYNASKKEWRKFQSKKGTENGETASAAKEHGVNYYKTLVRASEGNLEALTRIFSLGQFMDGAAAEGYYPDMWKLFHMVDDKTFAGFLRRLPLDKQIGIRRTLSGDDEEINGPDYIQRNFPETTKIFFRGEIVDWISPDQKYAIRKNFSNPLELTDSKVSHSEVIEKASGKAVCDLTADDIGAGSDREGSVLWSPDSKRFAYVSSDTVHAGNPFSNPPVPPRKTQTTVYQQSVASFVKADLPLNQPPGKETDPQITGAVMEHDSVTPTRWEKANTLILERHDYYEKLILSSAANHSFARLYEITVSFKEDGTASTSWKLRDDH
ncbi:MAG TPA: delta-60 repeat domain-containing protein [Candidatus Udaeobacter sp.]|nr:delta-60 repeat domain-containing protein [Candidatus Udaeobacter sp.]